MAKQITTTPCKILKKHDFIGRVSERAALREISTKNKAGIVVVYGRRRVGKTEIIEQTFAERNLLKFEGLEKQGKKAQLQEFLSTLRRYSNDPTLLHVKLNSWSDAFNLLSKYTAEGKWTIYLEELQWMANYESELISVLKSVWDNSFRHNPELLIILCGSAPSFMINKVLHSSALYNRSETNFPIAPFSLPEAQEFMGKSRSLREIMDAVLSVGAIPPYLERLRDAPSVFLGLAENSFKKNSYFSYEYERIFISSLTQNPAYRAILEFLSNISFASRDQIAEHLQLSSGGMLTSLLEDLEQSGFIFSYHPPKVRGKSRLRRFELSDPYIRWYNKWIMPNLSEINQGLHDKRSTTLLNLDSLRPWMGYSFERWLRQHPYLISRLLGFDGIAYRCGAYYDRSTKQGVQIDLVYQRPDKYITVVEAKYTERPVGIEVIEEFEEKLTIYKKPKTHSLQKVLVSAAGADTALIHRGYFDRILTLEDLFKVEIW